MHIGLFDSGVGGLTVLKELVTQIPDAKYTYLGDTARLPYGNKAPKTLRQYTQENIEFLESRGVEIIVVACHSASSTCLNLDKSTGGTPLINVIQPSCEEAIAVTQTGRVGVMSTHATAKSGVYSSQIKELDSVIHVEHQACPLLVPLVEEGMLNDPITNMALRRYLTPLLDKKVDTIILGCTHYPILKKQIAEVCGEHLGDTVQLIDPAQSVAMSIKRNFIAKKSKEPGIDVFLTDHAPHFINHAKKWFAPLEEDKIQYPKG